MKKTLLSLMISGLVASVHAAPISFTDIYNPADTRLNAGSHNNSLTFTHNILDNGFLPATHNITNATLSLNLADDDQDRVFFIFPIDFEYANVTADHNLLSPLLFEVDGSRQFTVSSALLQYDGKLTVTVNAVAGDFWFRSSELNVAANSPEAVPEPGTMALMALGLLGMGFAARRRK